VFIVFDKTITIKQNHYNAHERLLFLGEITMENDSKNVEVIPEDKSSWITRRKMFQITAVGVLVAVTGLQIVYRRSKSSNALAPTEISIDGPFKEYGNFRPKDLGREDLNKLASDFKLETLILDEGKYHDNVMIAFTFTGKESPNRKMKIFLTVYDKEGKVIGGAENIFDDPRIMAKEEFFISKRRVLHSSTATLTARLIEKVNITQISRIDVLASEIPRL
jgi:hypothetical protein